MFVEEIVMQGDQISTSMIALSGLAIGLAFALSEERSLVYSDVAEEFRNDVPANRTLFQSQGFTDGQEGTFCVERDELGRLMVEENTGDPMIPAQLTYIG